MHPALHLEEILLDIFGHLFPTGIRWIRDNHRRRSTAALAALARTCRAFKEPALNVLWCELVDLTSLVRCLPEACCMKGRRYSLKRRLNETELSTLRSYTRRIWGIYGYAHPVGYEQLDDDVFVAICRSFDDCEPFFPNLRSLLWQREIEIPLADIAVPSLTSLDLDFTEFTHATRAPGDFLDSIASRCPNIKHFNIFIRSSFPESEALRRLIRRCTNLRLLDCFGVPFDANTIVQLSEMPYLRRLSLRMNLSESDAIPLSCPALVFSTLIGLEMSCSTSSLESLTRFLCRARLPALKDLVVLFPSCPTKDAFASYLTTVQSACSSAQLSDFRIRSTSKTLALANVESSVRLTLEDVRPCMAFVNLRHLDVSLQWAVDLTDDDLLALVSAWPCLQSLSVNENWGWRTTVGGITLQGLLRVLSRCRALVELCVAIHTGTYVDPPRDLLAGFARPSPVRINLADSLVRAEDVPALVDVFVQLEPHLHFVTAWDGQVVAAQADGFGCRRMWRQVFSGVAAKLSASG